PATDATAGALLTLAGPCPEAVVASAVDGALCDTSGVVFLGGVGLFLKRKNWPTMMRAKVTTNTNSIRRSLPGSCCGLRYSAKFYVPFSNGSCETCAARCQIPLQHIARKRGELI